ncbi:MAG: plastocyanin/azurin family copper-binding protein [Halodesulfurarchaeum sp.]
MDGTFTFPASGDPPVTTNGNPIVKPFDVTITGRKSASVSAADTSFDPVRLSVEPGTTVTWSNTDPYGHDVTSAQFHDSATDWSFSRTLPPGGTVSHTFDSSGVYEYYCTVHGRSTMCGVVMVGDVSLEKSLPCESTM